jgi:hypothetical protein
MPAEALSRGTACLGCRSTAVFEGRGQTWDERRIGLNCGRVEADGDRSEGRLPVRRMHQLRWRRRVE